MINMQGKSAFFPKKPAGVHVVDQSQVVSATLPRPALFCLDFAASAQQAGAGPLPIQANSASKVSFHSHHSHPGSLISSGGPWSEIFLAPDHTWGGKRLPKMAPPGLNLGRSLAKWVPPLGHHRQLVVSLFSQMRPNMHEQSGGNTSAGWLCTTMAVPVGQQAETCTIAVSSGTAYPYRDGARPCCLIYSNMATEAATLTFRLCTLPY